MFFVCSTGDGTQGTGCPDQRTGLATLDGQDLLFCALPLLTADIQHLAANHAQATGTFGQDTDGIAHRFTLQFCGGCNGEGICQQCVTGKDSHSFTVDLVVGESATAVIIIIHAGQVVMDQAICMDHFHSCSQGRCLLPVATAQSAKLKSENRPQPLATGKQAILHGFKQLRLGFIPEAVIPIDQEGLNMISVDFSLLHRQNPPARDCHRQRSSPS